ncbi:hypothetical protein MicvaDRAFT_0537 [Microcoleus vaginatus FGP-2]|nr:hypothetical protein MicvaDRAFT_0537 [Microcoleus vaginatus FGP-2]
MTAEAALAIVETVLVRLLSLSPIIPPTITPATIACFFCYL